MNHMKNLNISTLLFLVFSYTMTKKSYERAHRGCVRWQMDVFCRGKIGKKETIIKTHKISLIN